METIKQKIFRKVHVYSLTQLHRCGNGVVKIWIRFNAVEWLARAFSLFRFKAIFCLHFFKRLLRLVSFRFQSLSLTRQVS